MKQQKNIRYIGTGITLSHEQYAEFQDRIQAEGLKNFLHVELMDYRDLTQMGVQYDRVVSVGMAEHVENLRLHYNKTLLCWLKNYEDHIHEIREMFDERFVKMWELYLASCAATFHNGIIDLHQVLATKGINNDLPMTRWY